MKRAGDNEAEAPGRVACRPGKPVVSPVRMPSFERDYSRSRQAMRPKLPPVTKWLLIVNFAIFFLDLLQRGRGDYAGPINEFGSFSVAGAILGGRIWEFLTFQFCHATLGHVFFNSLGLFFFGPFVENWWGGRRFLRYYLLCGVGGALFYTLLLSVGLLPASSLASPLVGASAGLFGVLFTVYVIAPAARVRLLIPPVEMSMRTLALVLAGISVAVILGGLLMPEARLFWNSGGEAGHLGGAIVGLILMKNPWLLGRGVRPGRKIIRPKAFRPKTKPKLRPRSTVDPTAASEIDRILDKVSAEGFGSLTEAERRTLQEAGRKG